MSENIIVSIRLMTYNHEKYIKMAMNGIMDQQTSFKFEVVVGDDFSSDHTLEEIRSYKSTERISIKILERKQGDSYSAIRKKYGRLHNFYNILDNCSGKFIALLDGDDYWIDPLKLQKQVDFLESNPEYVIHGANALNYLDGKVTDQKKIQNDEELNRDYDLEYYRIQNNLVTATVMFRNVVSDLPKEFRKSIFGDWGLYIFLLKKTGKKCYVSSENFAVYRIHQDGIYSKMTRIEKNKNHIKQIRFNKFFLNEKNNNIYNEKIVFYNNQIQLFLEEIFYQKLKQKKFYDTLILIFKINHYGESKSIIKLIKYFRTWISYLRGKSK